MTRRQKRWTNRVNWVNKHGKSIAGKKNQSSEEKDTEQDSSSWRLGTESSALLQEELRKQAQEVLCSKYRCCPVLLLCAHLLLRCLQNWGIYLYNASEGALVLAPRWVDGMKKLPPSQECPFQQCGMYLCQDIGRLYLSREKTDITCRFSKCKYSKYS